MMSMNKRRFGNSSRGLRAVAGFTLVEMLASLAMVAIVLPVAMEAIGLALSAAGFARQQREAAAFAQMKLAELVSTGSWQTGTLSGDFSDDQSTGLPPDWQAYTWSAVVTPYSYQNGDSLQELDVTVTWTARGTNPTVTLNTLIYTGGTGGNG